MISLVVCSVNTNYLSTLKRNVDELIGIEHEWLVWDNRQLNLGLSEVYNKMAEKVSFPFICFLHEDIIIKTKNWGPILIETCINQSISLIGVAGGKYKSTLFSGWYSGGKNLDYYSLIHLNGTKEEKMQMPEAWERTEVEVASIDGVFMFCKKEVWRTNRFNDALLKGFHCYDIDFSLRVAQVNKVVVTNRLDLVHYTTGGDYGDNWVIPTVLYHRSIKAMLPFSVTKDVEENIDIKTATYWLDWLKNMEISWSNRLKWIRMQELHKYPSLYYGIAKFLLYRPLRLKSLHNSFQRKFSS